MNLSLRIRLSFMMLIEYFIWGAWYVTLGTWLATSLHFSGQQIGLAAGTTAVGAIIAPFFVGLIADRLFNTQRVLALLHIAGAILLYIASLQTSFLPFYGIVLAYCLCFMPTLALTNSLAFRQMKDPREQFGSIRVLGSGGWILAGPPDWHPAVGGDRNPDAPCRRRLATDGSLLLYSARYTALGKNRKTFRSLAFFPEKR
jgi:MFS family permease